MRNTSLRRSLRAKGLQSVVETKEAHQTPIILSRLAAKQLAQFFKEGHTGDERLIWEVGWIR